MSVKTELEAALDAIKQRQKAAQSSTDTKALLIQTFITDLPWLIEQVERLEQENAECQGKPHSSKAQEQSHRNQIDTLHGIAKKLTTDNAKLERENAELRQLNIEQTRVSRGYCGEMIKARNQVARLREALETIASQPTGLPVSPDARRDEAQLRKLDTEDAIAIARSLEGEKRIAELEQQLEETINNANNLSEIRCRQVDELETSVEQLQAELAVLREACAPFVKVVHLIDRMGDDTMVAKKHWHKLAAAVGETEEVK